MINKIQNFSKYLVNIAFIVIMIFIFSGNMSYLFDNSSYRLIITLLLISSIGLFTYIVIKYEHLIKKYNLSSNIIIMIFIIIIIIQIIIITHLTFPPTWDNSMIIKIAKGKYEYLDRKFQVYLVRNSNNLLLALFTKLIYNIHNLFNFKFDVHFTLNILYVSIFDFTVYCWYKYINYLYSKKMALLSSFIILLFVTFSGHIIITYSDIISLSLPMIFAYLLINILLTKKVKSLYIKIIILGLIFTFAIMFKPTTIIIMGLLLLNFAYNNYNSEIKKVTTVLIVFLLASSTSYLITSSISQYVFHTKDETNKNITKKDVYHFLHIGLNEETNGAYYDYPELYTLSPKEVPEFNKNWIKQRIKQLGIFKLIYFMYLKWSYGAESPTFAAFIEGEDREYFEKRYNRSNNILTTFSHYSIKVSKIWLNVLWVLIGLGLLFCSLSYKYIAKYTYKIIIIGMFAYLSLFEFGRSRYMIIFFPYMILLSIMGWNQYFIFIRNYYNKKMKKNNKF